MTWEKILKKEDVCPKCKGEGKFPVDEKGTVFVTCKDCGGSGKLKDFEGREQRWKDDKEAEDKRFAESEKEYFDRLLNE